MSKVLSRNTKTERSGWSFLSVERERSEGVGQDIPVEVRFYFGGNVISPLS